MTGHALTTASTIMCPHGGQVSVISTNTRARADGAFIATASDTFLVSGCPFQLPGPVPSPCVTLRWIVPDSRVRVNGQPTLSRSSTALALSALQAPQGSAIVVNTQVRASTS